MAEKKKEESKRYQPGDVVPMVIVKMTLGTDGKTYATLKNDDVFMNTATVMLRKE